MIVTLTKLSLLLLFIALLSACASNETFNTAKEINEECKLEFQAALTIVRLRVQGKTQSQMQKTLPPIQAESSRLLRNLHEIVTETYQYSTLNETTYATYRFELCMRQLQNKPYPNTIAVVEQPLLNCQQQYGMTSSKQSTECVIQAIDNLHANQLINPRRQREPSF